MVTARKYLSLLALVVSSLASTQLPSAISPASASHQPTCKVYVATTSAYVHVIDTIDGSISVFPSNGIDGSGPGQWSVGLDRTGEKLFVGLAGAPAGINVFETTNYGQIATIALAQAYRIAASPTEDRIYAVDYTADKVRVIDSDTSAILSTVNVGTDPADLAVSADGQYVFVANSNAGTITRIQTSNDSTVVGTVGGAGPIGNPMSIALSPDDSNLFVVGSSIPGVLASVDPTSLVISNDTNIGQQLYGVAATPDGDHVLVTSSLDGTVFVRDAQTLGAISDVAVGGFPVGIEVTPDGRYAYVVNLENVGNLNDDSISRIRLSDLVVEDIPLLTGVNSLTIGPSNCVTQSTSHGNRSPRRTVSLDPNGGTCIDGQSHQDEWSISFRGSRTIPGPDECTREGFAFGGWANIDTPDVVRELPIVEDSVTGTRRYQISRDSSLIAIWHALPARPTDFLAASRLFCTSCNDVWLAWTTPSDGSSVTIVDDSGDEVCATGFLSGGGWNLCVLTSPDQRARTFSLTTKNQYGSSAPLTATVSFGP